MNRFALLASAAIITSTTSGPSLAQEKTLTGAPTIVVAHRGASGYLPEHTLEAYKMAIDMGADYIEPDLVVTKDGVLIARHEPMLSGTTDVANRPEFASRKTTRKVDGVETTDWFASDFTLAEIKQLRAKQAMADRDQSKNGQFQIPTLQEVIDLAKKEGSARGKTIGIAPETKHSTFHAALGLPMEDRLVTVLKEAGWADASAPVVIQSFEVANLKYLNTRIDVRLAQLLDADDVDKDGNIVLAAPYAQPYDFVVVGDKRTYKDLLTKEGLAEVKSYADILAPWKPYILPTKQVDQNNDGKADDLNGDGKTDEQDRVLAAPTTVVKDAHAAGLQVFTWTFRNEPKRLASTFKGDPAAEYKAFYALGVDGLFSDFPDTAVKAR
ncbi:glycerophosphodiester phosphodiesterase [Microvirga arsenatis]|uniref:glycerophosphodiester phosphodiesterase n=1 Tax=Microvirga arsenatis TaxID=2692265 RepID=A0ABW9YSM2_9HYPH|nr:glycerophosphodiester phosphodiesterase [Microvirga arsenatis]NBJ10031.1 glycerophosphodiester phosphodiesterase [Microvirga arsenatis]NBJ23099.1 glycerophosphodiester phosphodiesterase [Microvirga arsenatis]